MPWKTHEGAGLGNTTVNQITSVGTKNNKEREQYYYLQHFNFLCLVICDKGVLVLSQINQVCCHYRQSFPKTFIDLCHFIFQEKYNEYADISTRVTAKNYVQSVIILHYTALLQYTTTHNPKKKNHSHLLNNIQACLSG